MFRARVLTEWVQILDRWEMYPATLGLPCSVADVTAQPADEIAPTPNAVVVEVVGAEADLDTIAADPKVTELWREEFIDGAE